MYENQQQRVISTPTRSVQHLISNYLNVFPLYGAKGAWTTAIFQWLKKPLMKSNSARHNMHTRTHTDVYYYLGIVVNNAQLNVSLSYLGLVLCLWTHIHTTTAASMIIPTSTTPPTPPATGVIPKLSSTPVAIGIVESVPNVVGLTQSACALNESTSIGQLGYTLILLLWTMTDV